MGDIPGPLVIAAALGFIPATGLMLGPGTAGGLIAPGIPLVMLLTIPEFMLVLTLPIVLTAPMLLAFMLFPPCGLIAPPGLPTPPIPGPGVPMPAPPGVPTLGVPLRIALIDGVCARPGLPATLPPAMLLPRAPASLPPPPLPIENVLPTPVSMRLLSGAGEASRSRLSDGDSRDEGGGKAELGSESRTASSAARWAFRRVRSMSFRKRTESLA